MDARTMERVGEALVAIGCVLLGAGVWMAFGLPGLLSYGGGLAIAVGVMLATAPAGGQP